MSRCAILLLSLFVVLSVLLSVSAQESENIQARPTRPEKFTSQAQLNEYVRKLQEYYKVNAGRYGKRDLYPDRRYDYAIRRPNALYDFLSQYDYDRSDY